ncbi:hypothetical protein O0Q50_19380 [Priestia aryabhattai]|uniref:Lipoprotein n=1 Tax=Priestia aryabhattai TaxID=412384 RepID=A0AAX6NC20_PRIAR|nr:hypothetical protein [Priestia aryabhattai]MDU9693337.1 hypothetical protein [Priestia aryabhattai]
MKKELFGFMVLLLLCVGALTGCGSSNEKEASTNSNQVKEEETKSEEENEAVKKKETQVDTTEETEKEENQAAEKDESSTKKESESKVEVNDKQPETTTSKAKVTVSQADWGSTWTRDINTDRGVITITEAQGDTLKFSINATHTNNAEAARAGNINVGDVEGTAKVSGNVATQTTADEDTGCSVKMTNHQSYIQVEAITDCSMAGGLGVSFDGKYQKGNIPETDWWKEDDTNTDTSNSDTSNTDTSNAEEQPSSGTEESDTEDAPTDTIQTMTPTEAEQRVKEFLSLPADTDLSVECGGDKENGMYLVRVYKYEKDNPDYPYGYDKFYGNYYVDLNTGDVKNADY